MEIKIEYNGAYPNLCSGKLFVTVAGTRYEFPDYCLSSGGSVSFDEEWNESVGKGDWSVADWPVELPVELHQAVEDAINEQIPHGCCGGCV